MHGILGNTIFNNMLPNILITVVATTHNIILWSITLCQQGALSTVPISNCSMETLTLGRTNLIGAAFIHLLGGAIALSNFAIILLIPIVW